MIGPGESEDLYFAVAELSKEALMVADLEANILSVSSRTLKMFGYDRPEEMVGLSGFEFFVPEDRQRAGANFQRRFLSGKLGYMDYTFVRADGSRFPGEMNVSPFNDSDGNIKGVVAIVRDVSEIRATYSELLDATERLEATLSALPDLMFEVDTEGRIFDYRTPRDELLYESPERFIGRRVADVLPPEAADIIMESVAEARRTGKSSGLTYSLRLPDAVRWFELSIAAKGEPGGSDGHMVALVRDITQRMFAEEALQRSEERFRTVADFTYDWEIWSRPDGSSAYVSPSCQRITGYSRAEFMEDPELLLKITHPDDRETILAHRESERVSLHAMQLDFRIINREGSERWISHMCQPVHSEDGMPQGRRISNRDITERMQTERALAESETLFRSLVEAAPDGVTLADLEGKIISASQSTADLHGYDGAEELIGMSAFDLLPAEERERAAANKRKTLSEGRLTGLEYNLLKKDGSTFIGEMNTALIRDSANNPRVFLTTTRDITRRKRDQAELNALNADLEAFARTVSHDLKGPLASISMSNELLHGLLAGPLTEEARSDMAEMIGTTQRSLDRALVLIDDLLSNAEAGEKPTETTVVDVAGVIKVLMEEQAPLIESCHARLLVDTDLGRIVADATHIYQLFSNLITNALKYCDSKRPNIEIRFLGDEDSGAHRYLARDDGSGIPPEALDKIFEPFFKGNNGDSGIGLSIVDKIVRSYGGDIRAYNDGGACFEFSLMDYRS